MVFRRDNFTACVNKSSSGLALIYLGTLNLLCGMSIMSFRYGEILKAIRVIGLSLPPSTLCLFQIYDSTIQEAAIHVLHVLQEACTSLLY